MTGSDIGPNTLIHGATRGIGATLSNNRLVMWMVVADLDIRKMVRRFTGPPLSSFHAELFETRETAQGWIAAHVGADTP